MQSLPRAERVGEKPLRAELSNFIMARAFEYLLQRIDYLGGDPELSSTTTLWSSETRAR